MAKATLQVSALFLVGFCTFPCRAEARSCLPSSLNIFQGNFLPRNQSKWLLRGYNCCLLNHLSQLINP